MSVMASAPKVALRASANLFAAFVIRAIPWNLFIGVNAWASCPAHSYRQKELFLSRRERTCEQVMGPPACHIFGAVLEIMSLAVHREHQPQSRT
jgi:hypothetical protein